MATVNIVLNYTLNSQEVSQRRTRVSLGDTAVTPTLCADLDRELSLPVSVLLASTVMDVHVTVRMIIQKRTFVSILSHHHYFFCFQVNRHLFRAVI